MESVCRPLIRTALPILANHLPNLRIDQWPKLSVDRSEDIVRNHGYECYHIPLELRLIALALEIIEPSRFQHEMQVNAK